jgi:hypothetical protein
MFGLNAEMNDANDANDADNAQGSNILADQAVNLNAGLNVEIEAEVAITQEFGKQAGKAITDYTNGQRKTGIPPNP